MLIYTQVPLQTKYQRLQSSPKTTQCSPLLWTCTLLSPGYRSCSIWLPSRWSRSCQWSTRKPSSTTSVFFAAGRDNPIAAARRRTAGGCSRGVGGRSVSTERLGPGRACLCGRTLLFKYYDGEYSDLLFKIGWYEQYFYFQPCFGLENYMVLFS